MSLTDRAHDNVERWRADPVAFGEDVFGLTLWDDGKPSSQADIARSYVRSDIAATRSGHKIGKSMIAALLAWWAWALWPGARVVLTAPTFRQVQRVIWREMRALYRRARVPLGARMFDSAATGIVHRRPDLHANECFGLAVNDPDAFSGVSGAHVFYLVDEASGVAEEVFDAIDGNRAGGARLWQWGNPTQTAGRFFDSFHSLAHITTTHVVSSERVAEINRRGTMPGLATPAWVTERKLAWGVEDPRYLVRVLGEFPPTGINSAIKLRAWLRARERWDKIPQHWRDDLPELHRRLALAGHRLAAGLDVARFGDDRNALAPRRGGVLFPIRTIAGLDGKQLAEWAEVQLHEMALPVERTGRGPGAVPLVNVDVIGVGASAYDFLAYKRTVEAHPINVAEKADDPDEYSNLRSQLWFGANDFLDGEGAVPEDGELRSELLAPTYRFDAQGRMQLEPKDTTKERLGRSPDRGDATVLAVYKGNDLRGFNLRGL